MFSRKVPDLLPWESYHSDHLDSMYNDLGSLSKFTNLDGLHTGVPTPTTPTLTPTTLRNFEQTILNLERETAKRPEHLNEAGFVPPPIDTVTITQGGNNNNKTFVSLVDTKAWLGGSTTITPTPVSVTMNRPITISTSSSHMPMAIHSVSPPPPTRRNLGGRRPNKSIGLSAEEEDRRLVRRERNKLAAARCRKRRLDHTNELVMEVEELEHKKMNYQNQIQAIQTEKEQLEFLLEAHSANCRLGIEARPPSPPEIKPVLYDDEIEPRVLVQQQPQLHPTRTFVHGQPRMDAATVTSQHQPNSHRRLQLGATAGAGGSKPSRPTSLPVASKPHEVAGVPITTPSSIIPLNFDSLMDGGSGFTPVAGSTPYCKEGGFNFMIPSCSTQQRNDPEITSPDSLFPPKLVSL